jgi:hypothetical protein
MLAMLIKVKKQLLRDRLIGLIRGKDEKVKSREGKAAGVQKATGKVCTGRVAAVHNVRSQGIACLFDDLRKSEQLAIAGGYR